MSLLNQKVDAKFEDPEADTGAATAQADTAAATATAAPAKTAVAVRQGGAVAVSSKVVSPFSAMENAYRVDFNTLTMLGATQGNFFQKDTEANLGDTITLQLLSHQPNYVVSPGTDDEDDAKLVKYSDDGKVTKDGEDVVAYVAKLRASGYGNAKLTQRLVLVGALIDPGKVADLKEQLVQIDLAPSSKAMFDRYSIQSSFDISRGKTTPDAAQMLRMTTKTAKNGKNTYTVVHFSQAPQA